MDTGGLAQMTYNNNNGFPATNVGLSTPGSGYASRGKGAHIKRLSVAPPPRINSIYEDDGDQHPTPRTSRSHLLAGLRTAPKNSAVPMSAPYNVTDHRFGLDASKYGERGNVRAGSGMPQSAVSANFPSMASHNSYGQPNVNHRMYSLPEHVLAPPAMSLGPTDADHMDPQLYDELMATNMYLVQRQQQLQQQLINVTAAAQQFQGMSLNGAGQQQYGYASTPATPQDSLYAQQLQNGVQPIIQAVPGRHGLYSIYNPMTGQQSYFLDPTVQQQQGRQQQTQMPPANGFAVQSPAADDMKFYRPDTASPPLAGLSRTITPPKQTPSPPRDVAPLPPPSANAFRPGHKKAGSSVSGITTRVNGADGTRNAVPRSAGFPQTPQTGTFGPGMGRAGEHPTRQPRGPPPLEELVAAPTSKHEGSKNFATRQRRRAVHNLVRAGKERRSVRPDSAEGTTPTSESELNLASSSDADSDGARSDGTSGRRSVVSLRANATGAIGSERKEFQERSRERIPLHRQLTASSVASEESTGSPATMAAKLARTEEPELGTERRRMPMLVLTSAEKRKNSLT